MEYNVHVCTICCCLYHVVFWCQLSYVPKVPEIHFAPLLMACLTRMSKCVGSMRLKTDSWWLKIVRCFTILHLWMMVDGWWIVEWWHVFCCCLVVWLYSCLYSCWCWCLLVSDLCLCIVLLVVLLVLVSMLFLFVVILIGTGYSDESYIYIYIIKLHSYMAA